MYKRQGESRFFISMEDDLMRLFGSDKTKEMVEKMGIGEDEPIEHGMLSKAIESAQKKVEGNNFATRKRLLEYDEVDVYKRQQCRCRPSQWNISHVS